MKLATFHLVFSNLWRWRSAVIKRSQPVHRHRDPLLAYAAPNADPVHGRLHLPSARHLLSQDSLTWDEWSSPGEPIHPGDSPSISSITSSAAKNCLRVGYSQRHSHGWPRPGSHLSRRSRGANREGVGRSSGCRKGLRGQHHIHLWLPGAYGSKCRMTRRFAMIIVGQCFWTDKGVTRCRSRLSCGRWWRATFRGRVRLLACCRRCLAGYGQSRRAPGASIWVSLRRVRERHSGGNLSALIMPDRWRATVSVRTRASRTHWQLVR